MLALARQRLDRARGPKPAAKRNSLTTAVLRPSVNDAGSAGSSEECRPRPVRSSQHLARS
jgi:hypothetical protein